MSARWFVALVLFVTVIGCFTNSLKAQPWQNNNELPAVTGMVSQDSLLENQRLKDKVQQLEQALSVLQREFYRQKEEQQSVSRSIITDDTISSDMKSARLGVQFVEFEERLREINGRIEKAEFLLQQFGQKLDNVLAQLDQGDVNNSPIIGRSQPVSPFSSDQLSVQPNGHIAVTEPSNIEVMPNQPAAPATMGVLGQTVPSAPLASQEKTPQEQYDDAFALLRQAKYGEAEAKLAYFIQQNKENPLVENAYYWLGETFYVQKEYEQAAIQFLRGYQQFSSGKKAPDNLLKLALSLDNLDKTKEACASLDKLTSEFPTASNAILQRAKREYARIKC